MTLLSIQVLGKGLIPRGLGLAPRKEFFKADLNLIHTILACPGLKVNMITPDKKVINVTNSNLKTLWDKYRSDISHNVEKKVETPKVAPVMHKPNVENTVKTVETPSTTPIVVEEKKMPEVIKVEEKVEEKKEEKVEEKKDEVSNKPFLNDKDSNKNFNHNNHNKK